MIAPLKLAERCEQATGPDRELDAIILATLHGYTAIEERNGWIVAVGKGVMERTLGLIDPGKQSRNFTPQSDMTPAFTASLDAAMTLAEPFMLVALSDIAADGLTGCCLCSDTSTNPPTEHWGIPSERPASRQSILALAVCAAALRARAEAETHKPSSDHPSEIPVE